MRENRTPSSPDFQGQCDPHLVLAGFMDDGHLQRALGATPPAILNAGEENLEDRIAAARATRENLAPVDLDAAIIGPLPEDASPHLDRVRDSDDFQDLYGDRDAEFRLVDPKLLCAFQTRVKTTYERRTPGGEIEELLPYCLPEEFQTPTEASVNQTNKGLDVTLSADSPNVTVRGLEIDDHGAHIGIGAKRNWVQVAIHEGRPYVKNGYHRILQLLKQGVEAVPAIVYEAQNWDDAGGNKTNFFGIDYLRTLDRPPLVSDFLRDVAIEVPIRRTKKLIRIEVDEFAVPV